MSHGFRVWGESGDLQVDVSDTLQRFVGVFSYSFPQVFGSHLVVTPPFPVARATMLAYSTNVFHYATIMQGGSIEIQRNPEIDYSIGQTPQSGRVLVFEV